MFRVIVILLLSVSAFGQTDSPEYNRTDARGQKQGKWRKYFPGDSIIRYEGQFEDDKPTGTFVFNFTNGEKRVLMHYRKNGSSLAENFFPGGALMAVGKYVDKEKDSTWRYFDPGAALIAEEHYIEGKKYGNWKTYFLNGTVLEEKYYENGLENGPYIRRYESGLVYFEAGYVQGALEGDAVFYHENGMIESEGKYYRDAREGLWKKYDGQGNLMQEVLYVKGVAQGDEGLILEDTSAYFKKDRYVIDDVLPEDYSKVPSREEEKKGKKGDKK